MNKKEKLTPQELEQKKSRLIRRWSIAGAAVQLVPLLANVACAASTATGPVQTLNNLISLVFNLIRAGGVIVLIIGIVNFATSFQSHDASQRVSGIMGIIGGLLIFFLKEILAQIGVTI